MSREAKPELPAVDDTLLKGETRHELVDGRLNYVCPAEEPHASRHSKLSSLLEAYVTDAYRAACDMLTRVSDTSNFAPDGSVYPAARDPDTGGRRLEELAFEIVSTQTLSHAAHKAAQLSARGVRRVFAVDVERERALEWSPQTETWMLLADADAITDRCFAAPLVLRDLVSAASTDDAVARALLAKKNPVIEARIAAGEERGRREGEERGRREGELLGRAIAVIEILRSRDVALTADDEARIRSSRDADQLATWLHRAPTATSAEALFGPS
ncbi:MAG: Uma2 family endonuclease [Myxococcota bacterium]